MSGLKVKMFARIVWLGLGINHHRTADLFAPLFSGSEFKKRLCDIWAVFQILQALA